MGTFPRVTTTRSSQFLADPLQMAMDKRMMASTRRAPAIYEADGQVARLIDQQDPNRHLQAKTNNLFVLIFEIKTYVSTHSAYLQMSKEVDTELEAQRLVPSIDSTLNPLNARNLSTI